MADKTIPESSLKLVACRLSTPEQKAFARLQSDLGHEGHGAQAATVKEVLRDAFKQRGYIGKPQS